VITEEVLPGSLPANRLLTEGRRPGRPGGPVLEVAPAAEQPARVLHRQLRLLQFVVGAGAGAWAGKTISPDGGAVVGFMAGTVVAGCHNIVLGVLAGTATVCLLAWNAREANDWLVGVGVVVAALVGSLLGDWERPGSTPRRTGTGGKH
jgi:hypothetical protein